MLRADLEGTLFVHEVEDLVGRLNNVVDVCEDDHITSKILPQSGSIVLQPGGDSGGKPWRGGRDGEDRGFLLGVSHRQRDVEPDRRKVREAVRVRVVLRDVFPSQSRRVDRPVGGGREGNGDDLGGVHRNFV